MIIFLFQTLSGVMLYKSLSSQALDIAQIIKIFFLSQGIVADINDSDPYLTEKRYHHIHIQHI